MLLIVLSVLGNLYSIPLFPGFDYLFGTIFVQLMLIFYGFWWGLLCAASAASFTILLWGHPYAFIWYVFEAAFVGMLLRTDKRRLGIVVYEAAYWPLIGMPLIYIFFSQIMNAGINNVLIVMLKQWVNGITNAVIALVLIYIAPGLSAYLHSDKGRFYPSIKNILFSLLSILVIIPSIAVMSFYGRYQKNVSESRIVDDVRNLSERYTSAVDNIIDRYSAVVALAASLDSTMNLRLNNAVASENIKRTAPGLSYLFVIEKNGKLIDVYPDNKTDDFIPKSLTPDFIKHISEADKPFLYEFSSFPDKSSDLWTFLAEPIKIKKNKVFVVGAININFVSNLLKNISASNETFVLLNKDRRVLASSNSNIKLFEPYDFLNSGEIVSKDYGVYHFIPKGDGIVPLIERYKRSIFVRETAVPGHAGLWIICSVPFADYQASIYKGYISSLAIMMALILFALLLSLTVSRTVSRPLADLSLKTTDLPNKLLTGSVLTLPSSRVSEFSALMENFRIMADSLSEKFREIKHTNENLEHIVLERTREIKELNEELEQRVIQRTKELEYANNELEAFSYTVSHDLRAPLRAIEGYSAMVSEDYSDKLDDEGRRYLNTIRANAIKMSDLIDDMLSFSRLSRDDLKLCTINMYELASSVVKELSTADITAKLNISVGNMGSAFGDSAMLRQVWINLISNAIKFTLPKADGKIEIGSVVKNGNVVYYVKDNGVGFDMQYSGKLFNVFQRLHSQQDFEGTGVGLAIVKRVIERHGGRVWAESSLSEGSIFSFTIPL